MLPHRVYGYALHTYSYHETGVCIPERCVLISWKTERKGRQLPKI